MTLSLPERLAMLMPPSVFYRRRIAQEARTGEPELAVLAELVPRGGIAVDVGANIGFFAYALADIADRVLAFEPNPDYALFARCCAIAPRCTRLRSPTRPAVGPYTSRFRTKGCSSTSPAA
jgi:hypothetical protein